MKTLPVIHTKVLEILAAKYSLSCTIEEMTSLLTPVIHTKTILTDNTSCEREKQAIVLDALLALNDESYIFLNSNTDNSSITIKGLIKINSKIFCN